jgi:hypothetical protein
LNGLPNIISSSGRDQFDGDTFRAKYTYSSFQRLQGKPSTIGNRPTIRVCALIGSRVEKLVNEITKASVYYQKSKSVSEYLRVSQHYSHSTPSKPASFALTAPLLYSSTRALGSATAVGCKFGSDESDGTVSTKGQEQRASVTDTVMCMRLNKLLYFKEVLTRFQSVRNDPLTTFTHHNISGSFSQKSEFTGVAPGNDSRGCVHRLCANGTESKAEQARMIGYAYQTRRLLFGSVWMSKSSH